MVLFAGGVEMGSCCRGTWQSLARLGRSELGAWSSPLVSGPGDDDVLMSLCEGRLPFNHTDGFDRDGIWSGSAQQAMCLRGGRLQRTER